MKITERGWGAHFICGSRCRFRRNTLIEGLGGKVIVSTVGNMVPSRPEDGSPASIGAGINEKRYYETMVFETEMDGPYLDADVLKQRSEYTGKQTIYAKSPEDLPENADIIANDMHEAAVRFYVQLLRKV